MLDPEALAFTPGFFNCDDSTFDPVFKEKKNIS
jgi:hypothetical protein